MYTVGTDESEVSSNDLVSRRLATIGKKALILYEQSYLICRYSCADREVSVSDSLEHDEAYWRQSNTGYQLS